MASDSALGTPTIRVVKPVRGLGMRIGLALFARDMEHLTRIDIDALPACGWVHTYDWVRSLNWLAADGQPRCACASCLCDGTVHGGQTLDVSLETGAEGRVECVSGAPERVSACFGARDHLE